MKKKILFITLAVVLIAVVIAFKFMYKEHRDISSETASFTLTVNGLKQEFAKSDSLANAKYADKTIVISGRVTAVDDAAHTIVIDEKLSAVMKDSVPMTGQMQKDVKVKGRFVGYDDLLEELKMDQVSIIK